MASLQASPWELQLAFDALRIIPENVNSSITRRAIADVQKIVHYDNPDLLEKLITKGVLEALCHHLTSATDTKILIELLDLLELILSHSKNQMMVWAKRIEDCGGKYKQNIHASTRDPNLFYIYMCVLNFLGLDKMIVLQLHKDTEIYEKCYKLTGKFFQGLQDKGIIARFAPM